MSFQVLHLADGGLKAHWKSNRAWHLQGSISAPPLIQKWLNSQRSRAVTAAEKVQSRIFQGAFSSVIYRQSDHLATELSRSRLKSTLFSLVEVPVQDWSFCSISKLLQLRDNIGHAIAQKNTNTSQVTWKTPSQTTQKHPSQVIRKTPSQAINQGKEFWWLLKLSEQLSSVLAFLKSNVEQVLLKDLFPNHLDPRIQDVRLLQKPSEADQLQFVLGCQSLSDDLMHFQASSNGKKRKHTSERSFLNSLRWLDDKGRSSTLYGIKCEKKI